MLPRHVSCALVVLVGALSMVACGDGAETARPSIRTPTSVPAAVTTTLVVTTTVTPASSSTTPSTTAATAAGCAAAGSTADAQVSFPARLSSLIGKDVRTGAQDCFDRFVIEL